MSEAMSLDLDLIKARCEAATPGPWEPDGSEIYVVGSRDWVAESCRSDNEGDRDATFIAHARTDVPALVAEVERLRHQVAAAEHPIARVYRTTIPGTLSQTPWPAPAAIPTELRGPLPGPPPSTGRT